MLTILNKKANLLQTTAGNRPAVPTLSPAEATESATNDKEWAKLAACSVDPFSNEVAIPFTLPKAGEAQICVYNTLKKEVDKQVFANLPAGKSTKKLNLNQLNAGRYLIVVRSGGQSVVFYQFVR